MTKFAQFRTALATSTALAAALTFALPAMAQDLPDTGNVTSITRGLGGGAPGSTNPVFSNPDGNTLRVDLKDNRTILTWGGSGFRVASGNTVDFKDTRATSGVTGRTDNIAVLNRVVGANPPAIVNGTLRSDPNVAVYLVSQGGVFFGAGAVVDTGSFFASGSDINDDNAFLNGAATLRFSSGSGDIGVTPGAQFTTTASSSTDGGRMGDLVMIGSRIIFNGLGGTKSVANVAGDAALIVAEDVEVVSQPGSPLSFKIYAGSTFSDPRLFVGGDLTAANIVLAQTQAGSVAGALPRFEINGNLVATGAAVTDRGIVLTTGSAAPGVTMGTAPGTAFSSPILADGSIKQTGTISSAKNFITAAPYGYDQNNSIIAAGDIDFGSSVSFGTSRPAGVNAQDVTITGATIRFGSDAGTVGKVTATVGDIIANTPGRTLFFYGGVQAAGNLIVAAKNFSVNNGVSLGGALTADTVDSTVLAGGINAASISINSTGLFGYVSIGDATSTVGDISVASAYTLGAGNVAAAGALTLRGDYSVNAGAVSGSSVSLFSGASPFANPGVGTLAATSVTANTGNVYANGKIVGITNASASNGDITIESSGNLTIGGTSSGGVTVAGRDISITSNGGTIIARGDVTAGRNLTVSGSGLVTLGNSGSVAATMAAGGSLTAASSTSSVRGIGSLTLQSNADGSGTEALTITGAFGPSFTATTALLGGTARQSDLRIRVSQPSSMTLGRIEARGLLGAADGTSPFANGLTSPGPIALRGPISLMYTLYVNGLQILMTAGNPITVSNGAIDLRAASPLSILGALSASGNVTIQTSSGDLNVAATGSLAGQNIVLSTPGAFVNNGGAGIMAAQNHWVVYSAHPGGDTFGGLDSANTAIWNTTFASRNPSTVSGNRYVFAYQPILSFSSVDISKVYGTDLTGTAIPYAVSGYSPGVSGAFLGDTAATVFSGAPAITSAGFAERAPVSGSPYSQTIDAGSLQSLTGYGFAFVSSAGKVIVTPKSLSAVAHADDKTYDGTPAASGTLTLAGVLSGDSVDASAVLAFADKNAGTGKTVSVTSATLTGADAGNYTLILPGDVLADILKKALAANVAVDTKTYDGGTGATGRVTLSGAAAGDDVGTVGTVFAFADKNAGTGKTVNMSGTTLDGVDAGNYTLTAAASTIGDILKKTLGADIAVDTKTYDGTTAATGTVALTGIVAGDDVVSGGTILAFADKNAGTGKAVQANGTVLTGADSGNYTLVLPAHVAGDILKRALTATLVVDSKTYDGTTAGTGTVTLGGALAGDAVGTSGSVFLFGDKNAGNGKTVTISGTTLNGADAGNYTLALANSAQADILKKTLIGTVAVTGKTYDGSTAASGSVTLAGIVAGDTVGASGTQLTFADKNAGTGKSLIVAGTTLTGADAGNYILSIGGSAQGDILKRALVVAANDAAKDKDDPDPILSYTLLSGSLVAGDGFSGDLSRAPGEDPGAYVIGIGALSAGANYAIQFQNGVFTIRPLGPTPQELLQPFRSLTLPAQVPILTPTGIGSVTIETDAVCGDDKGCSAP